jgi:NTP pyrophosphatase (non-canonical NTP hydrolase)
MDDILKKVILLNEHFRKIEKPENTRLLERITKLNEEVGELCEAALVEVDENQRKKDKVVDFDSELADVLICTLMLSTGRKQNLIDRVNEVLDKNLKRHNLI